MANETLKTYSYDVEVFPNCFTLTAENIDDISDRKEFVLFHDMVGDNHRNDMVELNKFLNTKQYLLGYNSSKYDDIIVKYILSMTYKFKSIKEAVFKIKEFSDLVVSQQYNGYDKLVGAINRYKSQFIGIDFMKTMALDKSMKSLKQALINVKFHNIQDYEMPPITEEERKLLYPNKFDVDIQTMKPWNRYVLVEELPNLLAYNYNDVEGLTYLFKTYISEFVLRYNIQIKHGFYALSSSRSDLANRLMAEDYARLSNTSYWDFKDLRTHRRNIHLAKVIDNKVRFKSKELKKLYKDVFNTHISDTTKMGFKFTFDGNQYKMAKGGLHSIDRPQVFDPKGYALRDADVN